jgi:hypothetical protein
MKEDKTLVCRECGTEFVFSASEQEFYEEKGFTNEPGRCPGCRQARKQRAPGSRNVPCYLRRMRSRHRSTVPSFHGSSGILPRMLQCSQRLIINEVKKPIA